MTDTGPSTSHAVADQDISKLFTHEPAFVGDDTADTADTDDKDLVTDQGKGTPMSAREATTYFGP